MAQKIPFVDFTQIHNPIAEDIVQRIRQIIQQGSFILGPEVSAFEKEFAEWCGAKHCVGLASGMDALVLALKAFDIGPGHEVIVPANTFIATALAVTHVGAKPVFVDVLSSTSNMDPSKIEKAISKNTRAIIPVHLYGRAADMPAVLQIAKKHGLKVIEDTAQAHGAVAIGDKFCGNVADIGCYSFYPTKNLGAMGDGGAITTNDLALAEKISYLRNVGQKEKNHHIFIGHNSRLDSFQAAVLRAKLPQLHEQNRMRQQAAKWYGEFLKDVADIRLPDHDAKTPSVYHLFVIHTKSNSAREKLKKHLSDAGVGVAVHYPIPIHLQACYANLGYKAGDFPVAEQLADQALSLPMFPGISRDQVEYVAAKIKEALKV